MAKFPKSFLVKDKCDCGSFLQTYRGVEFCSNLYCDFGYEEIKKQVQKEMSPKKPIIRKPRGKNKN